MRSICIKENVGQIIRDSRNHLAINHLKIIFLIIVLIALLVSMISFFNLQIDLDTLSDALLVVQNPNEFISGRVKHFSFLLPMIIAVTKNFIDPLLTIYFLAFSAYVISGFLIYICTYSITNEKSVSLIALLFFLSSNSVLYLTFILDDNILPIPFFIASIYCLVVKEREIIAGVLFSISLSFHFQMIIFLPILLLYLLIKPTSHEIKKKVLNFGKFSITSQVIYFPLVSLMFIFKDRTDILRGYLKNGDVYFLFSTKSLDEIITWFLNWIKGLFLSLAPFPQSLYSTVHPVYFNYSFNFPSLIGFLFILITVSMILLVFIGTTINLSLDYRKNKNLTNITHIGLYKINFIIILIGMLFAFVYEPLSPERWVNIIPSFAIILGVNIAVLKNILIRKSSRFINLAKNIPKLFFGAISSGLITSILLLIIVGNFNTSIPWILSEDIPVQPNRDLIDDILSKIEPNSSLLIGPIWIWGIISYYHTYFTLYFNEFPSDETTLMSTIWKEGVGSQINKNQTIKKINDHYNTGEKIFVHSSALKFVRTLYDENVTKLNLIYPNEQKTLLSLLQENKTLDNGIYILNFEF